MIFRFRHSYKFWELRLLLGVFLLSSLEVGAKPLVGKLNAFELCFYQAVIPGIFLTVIRFKKILKIEPKYFPLIIFVGIVGFAVGLFFVMSSLQYIPAAKSAVILSTKPFYGSLLAIFFFKERFTLNKFIGLLIGAFGVYIIIYEFNVISLQSKEFLGLFYSSIAAIFAATFYVCMKKLGKAIDLLTLYGLLFLIAAISYTPFIDKYYIPDIGKTLPLLLYLGFGANLAGFVFYLVGFKNVQTSFGLSTFYLKPFFAAFPALIILHENLNSNFWMGLAIVILGLIITNKKQSVLKLNLFNRKKELIKSNI